MKKHATRALRWLVALLVLSGITISVIAIAQTKKETPRSQPRQGNASRRADGIAPQSTPSAQSVSPQPASQPAGPPSARPPQLPPAQKAEMEPVDGRELSMLRAEPDTPHVTGPDQALFAAVRRSDPEAVKALLAAKANVNLHRSGMTPLLIIAGKERAGSADVEILKQLLEQGADVKATDGAGRSALYLAVKNLQVEMVRLLLDHKSDPNLAPRLPEKAETPLALIRASLRQNPKDTRSGEIEGLLKQAGAR